MPLPTRRARRARRSGSQSVDDLIKTLFSAEQFWLKATAGTQGGFAARAESGCPACYGKGRIRQKGAHGVVVALCQRCKGTGASSEETADRIAEFIRSTPSEERLVVALVDLERAWGVIDDRTRRQLQDFIEAGELEIRTAAHRSAILRLWRAMNGVGEFSRRVRQGVA